MKKILTWVAIIAIAFFAIDSIMDDESTDNNQTENKETFDDSSEDVDADAGDVYGNAADDDNKSETTAPVTNWGDGTCREITTKEFYELVAAKNNNEVFIGEGPVVVDFWATWCGYCREIDPYLKALAKKYKGKVQFYKVNADKNEAVTRAYGIEALPTLFFCSGDDITIKTGAYSQDELEKMVKALK